MKRNERARKAVADDLETGERIEAIVMLSNSIGVATANSGGTVGGGGSALGTQYARELGIDLTDRRLRIDLLNSWLTVTDRRLLFHGPRQTAIRPRPGDLIWTCDRAGVELRHFDTDGYALINRVVHLLFPDDTHLLSATILRARLRRKPFDAEAGLLVEAFGPAAVEVVD